jgi:1,2-dihydroxy-3-keto-5-methylthiopentene dioxygenase
MSLLLEFSEHDPREPRAIARSERDIAAKLAAHGVRFERWPTREVHDDILAAYAPEIDRLAEERGYRSADLVQLRCDPSQPASLAQAASARAKFLAEHRHGEDEVRFFVEGAGMFALRFDECVLLLRCERGDLLSVPAGTRHWFDMGTVPHFCAIRMFGSEAGWVAAFTGDPIAQRFPSFDAVNERWP